MGSKQGVSDIKPVCPACGNGDIQDVSKIEAYYYVGHVEVEEGRARSVDFSDSGYADGGEFVTYECRDCGYGSEHIEEFLPGVDVPVAAPDETDACAYVETSARDLIGELRTLELLTQGGRTLDETQMLDCVDLEGPAGEDEIVEAAEDRLFSLPLAVEATTTFEVVLGCGGPDRRLCFECRGEPADWQPDPHTPPPTIYEVRRVLYRYSWDRSAEIELSGEDREVAEAFGRRVVPELVE